MEMVQLQQLLGVDKRNPVFTVYHNEEEKTIVVFFGTVLLEVVPDDKNNILYKMLVGKLYNAGIKRKSLEKAFGVTRTTMQRWGRAVKKRKEKEMLEALAGPGFPRKLTDVMERYIKERFAEIYAGNRYSYSKKLIIDIEKVFGKKISSSTIRPILSTIKKEQKEEKKTYIDELNKPVLNIVDNSGNPLTFGGAAITNIKIEEIVQNNLKEEGQNNRQYANSFCISTDGNKEEKRAYVGELSETAVMNTADNSSYDNSNIKTDKIVVQNKLKEQEQNNQQNANSFHINTSGYELCHHAGVLIFSSLVNGLKHLSGNVSENVKLIKQWIVGILLGAMNIEQTKLLDFNSVEVIIGKVIRSLETQRERLVKMSEEEQLRNMVLKYNGEIVKIEQEKDFYIDPHIKHYTGVKKLLKGWCPGIRFADTIMNLDFIHTKDGHPVYVEDSDNFNDARIRFKQILKKFRKVVGIPEEKVITYIADRGLYKIELFNEFMKEGSKQHFIIWEKGYKKDKWEEKTETEVRGEFEMFRARNSADDLLKYTFKYIDRRWDKDSKIRQIIVRATNPNGNMIEVSILASDTERDVVEIIKLMFKRWLQENDFKYLDEHFGINEITSYMAKPYCNEMATSLVDVQIKTGEYKALQMNMADVKKRLSKLLLQKHLSDKEKVDRDNKIEQLTKQLKEYKVRLENTQKEVSRLNTVINEGYFRMTTSTKALMDAVKITARNMFYEGFKPFKQLYNNYRDDHVIFRNLTRALGGVSFGEQVVDVVLYPTMNYQGKTKKVIEQLLENINKTLPSMPDGSNRILKFSLGQKASKLFSILPFYKGE